MHDGSEFNAAHEILVLLIIVCVQAGGREAQANMEETDGDCREWKLTKVDPQERNTWRSGVRSAMCPASQLPGKGPTDVDDAPAR